MGNILNVTNIFHIYRSFPPLREMLERAAPKVTQAKRYKCCEIWKSMYMGRNIILYI